MAHFFIQFSLLLVLIASSHARESQFFNKVPNFTASNGVVSSGTRQPLTNPQPDFLPDSEPAHGLYGNGHHLPSNYNPVSYVTESEVSNESPARVENHLPSNYNPVSYVTQSEATNESPARVENNKNQIPDDAQSFFITPEEQDPEFNRDGRNFVKDSDADTFGRRESSLPQGMSDTRLVDNGRFHYDIEAERYNANHPYQSFGRTNPEYDGFIGGGGQKSVGGYQQQQQTQNVDEFLNNNWNP